MNYDQTRAYLNKQQQAFFSKHGFERYASYSDSEIEKILADCMDESLWKPDFVYGHLEVNPVAGQVRSATTKKLLGSLHGQGFVICLKSEVINADTASITRGRLILRNVQRDRELNETVDHVDFLKPFDDRIVNLRWASKKEQALNRRTKGQRHLHRRIIQASLSPSFDSVVDEMTDLEFYRRFETTKSILEGVIRVKPRKSGLPLRKFEGFFWRPKPIEDVLPEETWIKVLNLKGKVVSDEVYVSSLGRKRRCGKITTGSRNKVLGYFQTTIKVKDGETTKTMQIYMHEVVCETFHGPKPSKKHTVDHIDRNRGNNKASNLRWATWEQQASNKN
jgi:hypothetical protein